MAPTVLLIKDVNVHSKNWLANVIVAEKAMLRYGKNSKPYQRLVFEDIEGNKVQATIFNDDIEVLKPTLKLYHTYATSNLSVRPIEQAHRFVTNDYQWQLSGQTPIKEIQIDGLNQRSIDHQLLKIADLETMTDADPKINLLFAILDVGAPRKTKTTNVCDLRVIDESMKPITITMWDQFSNIDAAAMENLDGPSPIALGTRLKYSPSYGETISTRSSSIFMINPGLQQAGGLQACGKGQGLYKVSIDGGGAWNSYHKVIRSATTQGKWIKEKEKDN